MASLTANSSAANNSGISPGLLFALLGSVLLHLWVLFGVPMRSPPQAYTPHLIDVKLVPAAPLAAPFTAPVTPAPASRISASAKATPGATPMPIAPVATETSTSAPLALSSEPPAAQPGIVSADTGLSDPTYYPIEQLDEPPRLLGGIRQVYPARARNAGIEGFVILSLLINERGDVDEIQVVKSQPIGFFEESAIATLRGQHFTPAIKQGLAVRSRWQKMVRFKLQD